MTKKISPYALGATLYMPATHDDILKIAFGRKIEGLRSMVVCLEDSVSDSDVEAALSNLQELLQCIEQVGGRPENGPLLFVRPRNAQMAAALNDWPLIGHVDGFVAPKLNLATLPAWETAMTHPDLLLMPTLETAEVFDPRAMAELKDALMGPLRDRIIALRIGGNDLMGCLGLRRSPSRTLYDGPMGYVIPMLCGIMGAAGFALTAPVFERMDNFELLEQELALDVGHGLVGKTAIHPSQIETIHAALRVSVEDLNSARLILQKDAAAVFKHGGAMCEPATHRTWAQSIVDRAEWHGVRAESPSIADGDTVVRPARFG
jgi:citrate lyase beta subunit